MKQYVGLPISRKFTYANFKQDDDIAFTHNNGNKIKFIVTEGHLYRVVVNNAISDSYSQNEYIIKEKHKSSSGSSTYEYQGTLEFKEIPSAIEITVINFDSDKLDYCTQEELNQFIAENFDLKLLTGRALFIGSVTTHTIGHINVGIKCESNELYTGYPICEITETTKITIDPNINSESKVLNIVELMEDVVIDVIVKDLNTTVKSSTNSKFEEISNALCLLRSSLESLQNDYLVKHGLKIDNEKYMLKSELIRNIKKHLSEKRFSVDSMFNICNNDLKINVEIDGLNNFDDNVAYILKCENVHINIQNNLKKQLLLDKIHTLETADTIIFNVVSAMSKVILKDKIIKEIKKQISREMLLKGSQFTLYINNDKIIVSIFDFYANLVNDTDDILNVAYICNKDNFPIFEIKDNVQNGIYITDTEIKHEIMSIGFKVLKKDVVANNDIALLLKVVATTDINANDVRQFFKYKIKESCVFVTHLSI